MGYPKVVKGYNMWQVEYEGSKFIIIRDITFNENAYEDEL